MYYLLLILLYPIALLPLPVLYMLSDILFVILYRIIGYRKDIVMDNLRHAFPEKSMDDLKIIQRKFYHSFCDQWIETLKLLTISEKELNNRLTANWELLHQLYAEGRNTYILLGHTFNWEWGNVAMQFNNDQQFAGVYMPSESAAVDRLIMKIRTRGGGWMISMKAKKGMQKLEGVSHLMGLIADQNPSNLNAVVWLPFMNREAPFFRGTEQMARRAKGAVVFLGIKKLRRGHYHMDMQLYSKDASTTNAGDITKAYVSFMEQQLKEQPENWMWTHRRWKYTKPLTS
jgi:Kdo2-lipid IVA lauroyltransferase/acyltransferase